MKKEDIEISLRDGRVGRGFAQHLQVDLGGGQRLACLVVQLAGNAAALLFLRGFQPPGELPQARIGFLEFLLALPRLCERLFALAGAGARDGIEETNAWLGR